MEGWLSDALKILLPSLMVFVTVYFMFRQFFRNQYQTRYLELKNEQAKTSLPLKLQAYERLALLFERINIPQLIFRLQGPQMTSQSLQLAMLVSIQNEFDHNLVQQIYVSDELWQILRAAKEETSKLVQVVSMEFDPLAPAEQMSDKLLEIYGALTTKPAQMALEAIRKEASQYV